MVKRLVVILLVGAIGIAIGSIVPTISLAVRAALNAVPVPPVVVQAAHAMMETVSPQARSGPQTARTIPSLIMEVP